MQTTDLFRKVLAKFAAPRLNAPHGFTLVEVMVALAVVAVSLPALLLTLSQQLDGLRHLEDRTQAQWSRVSFVMKLSFLTGKTGRHRLFIPSMLIWRKEE